MKTTIIIALALTSLSAVADTSIRTSQIDQWGYTANQLVLFTQSGEELKVTPKDCSLALLNETLSSGAKVSLDIPAKHVRQNTAFFVVNAEESTKSKIKCRVAAISA